MKELKERLVSYVEKEIKDILEVSNKCNCGVSEWEVCGIESIIEMLEELDIINNKECSELLVKLEELEKRVK